MADMKRLAWSAEMVQGSTTFAWKANWVERFSVGSNPTFGTRPNGSVRQRRFAKPLPANNRNGSLILPWGTSAL